MRTPEDDPFTRNEAMSLHPDDTPHTRYQPRPGVNPDLTTTPPTTTILTPALRTSDQDGHFLDTPGAETDSSALASLDINLEGDDPHDLSSCSVSDADGPSLFPGSHSPRPKKRRRRNRLRQLLSPDNVQFLYDDTTDTNGMTGECHSTEYPHATRRQRPPLEVPIIASRERSITQEGSSPSTILPGNALQLHLADGGPDGIFGSTSTITSFSSNYSSNNPSTPNPSQPPPPPISLDDDQTPTVVARHSIPKVHFRSRVRITSGLHSNNRSRNYGGKGRNSTADDGIGTANTSASGSPSSSISAPLRYQADENNILGPLGKRINFLAQTRNKRNGQLRRASAGSSVSERTPFLRASEYGPVPNYTHQRRERGRTGSESEDEDFASGLKREEEIMFGRWPWRVFNRRWWAYQCEPILCCLGGGSEDNE